ncbi:MAG TPA: galactofuranose ABC transporter, permease protein YjfF [Tepidisphaeraceae bacterium]|nr:galactofuranose ABC transporter, permease protein YjfF [Tepidisphaeraceae bacterium]
MSDAPLAYYAPASRIRRRPVWVPTRQQVPFLATAVVCAVLYALAGYFYPVFFSPRVVVNLLNDNAHLGIVAVGLTFVMLSGGIDLSVGSVVGCTGIALGVLITRHDVHPLLAIAIVLAGGVLLGTAMGSLIHFFDLPAFLVTLAGLFFCRGLALVISRESIQISHPFYDTLAGLTIPLTGRVVLPFPAIVFLLVLVVGIYVALFTRFGRNTYAIGGSESSALLMGLPVGRTKIGMYALSGFCAALGGAVFTIYKGSGNALDGTGMELDAIAAVVVGGTLLVGGIGQIAGTLLGVLIFAIIGLGIMFDGRLTTWWTRIALGLLLLAFILLQKLLQFGKGAED